jgi:hypothetical protein
VRGGAGTILRHGDLEGCALMLSLFDKEAER